jgi:ABC-type uncharacterized transport system permease subunit
MQFPMTTACNWLGGYSGVLHLPRRLAAVGMLGAMPEAALYTRDMHGSLLLNLSALVSLVPISALSWRRPSGRDSVFWILLAVAVIGPAIAASAELAQGWLGSLAASLWLSIAASMLLFVVVSIVTRHGWRLTPLLAPYLFLFGLGAALADQLPRTPPTAAPAAWEEAHALFGLATYGLLTIAAIAGLAVFLRERALKAHRPGRLAALLPSVADAELLQIQLLAASGAVLGLGLVSGGATQFIESGRFMEMNHKSIFAFSAFVVIALLLVLHHRTGLRGRRAARFVLLAYLLLTLAYPGVKFVTEVLLG